MNTFVKGAIATAAGVTLLLGGAGSFAYWNAEAGVQGGTVVAGTLSLENDGQPGVWKDQNGTTIDVSSYRVVPGDVLTYTDDLTVTATGDNLVATLALSGGAVTPTSSAPADQKLADYLISSAEVTASGTGVSGTGPEYTITAGSAGASSAVTTTVTLTFPVGTEGSDNDAQGGSVDLSEMAVSLIQNH